METLARNSGNHESPKGGKPEKQRECCVCSLRAWVVLGVLAAAPTAAGQTGEYLGPGALVASRDAKTLFVACADARQVAWVELSTGKISRRVDMPGEPTGLVLSPDGT